MKSFKQFIFKSIQPKEYEVISNSHGTHASIDKPSKQLTKDEKDNIIYFIHCREPHEIQKFVDKYKDKCITILLERNDRDVPNNTSDKNVANFNYDYIINNNGNKKDLEKEAINFLEKINKK